MISLHTNRLNLAQIEERLEGVLDQETLGRFLIFAIQEGQDQTALKILEKDEIDLNISDRKYGYTALHLAVFKNRVLIVEQLLERENNNINENRGKRTKQTPLIIAIREKYEEIAVALIPLMSDEGLNKPNQLGVTPLQLALRNRQYEVVRILIESRAVIDREKNKTDLINEVIVDESISFVPIIVGLSIKRGICNILDEKMKETSDEKALGRLIEFKYRTCRHDFEFQMSLNDALSRFVSEREDISCISKIIYQYV